ASNARRRGGIVADVVLLFHASRYAAARPRYEFRMAARHSAGCAAAAARPFDGRFRACVAAHLHTPAVLLRIHEPVSQRDRNTQRRGEDDGRTDVLALLHAA